MHCIQQHRPILVTKMYMDASFVNVNATIYSYKAHKGHIAEECKCTHNYTCKIRCEMKTVQYYMYIHSWGAIECWGYDETQTIAVYSTPVS